MKNYANQRDKLMSPVVGIRHVRKALHLSLEQLRTKILEETGYEVSTAQLNNVELGHRGASRELLVAWATALGLDPDDVLTDWTPRAAPTKAVA